MGTMTNISIRLPWMARTLMAEGDGFFFAEGIQEPPRGGGAESQNAYVFLAKALVRLRHGDFAAAADWYRAALDEYPGYCDAAFNLAQIHARVFPDPMRVVEVLEPVESSCAEDVGIRRLLGLSLCSVGRREECIEHLRFVATRKPGSEEARRELERALSQD